MEKKLSNEEILELSRLLVKIQEVDLGKLDEEKFEQLAPVDQVVAKLEDKGLRRQLKAKQQKPKRKKLHWKTKAARKKAYYYAARKPAKRRKKMELAKTPEGWYQIVTDKWKERGYEYFSLEDWVGIIWPHIGYKVPVFSRYSFTEGYTVGNIWVRDADTGDTLFDGKEHLLREAGYIL